MVGHLAPFVFTTFSHHPIAWILDDCRKRGSCPFSSAYFAK